MPESIQYLEEQLTAKRHELDNVSNALSGATIGAALTKGSLIGTLVGGALTHDAQKKEQLEREIADIEGKISATHDQISRLETKRSDLMNQFQNDTANFNAEMRQKRNDIERQKLDATTPELVRQFDDQLMRLNDDLRQQEASREQTHQQELDAVQREIDQLTF